MAIKGNKVADGKSQRSSINSIIIEPCQISEIPDKNTWDQLRDNIEGYDKLKDVNKMLKHGKAQAAKTRMRIGRD